MIGAAHASPAFNRRLAAVCAVVARDLHQAFGPALVATILGGGYGRGEGGVWVEGGRERPYNDLDFFLIVRSRLAVPRHVAERVARRAAPGLGIDVDVGPPLTLADVSRWPAWLMWHELLEGHHVLHGPPDVLRAHASAAARGPLPAIEATRLLLNRGAGLVWALRVARGLEPAPDPDFSRRNRMKAEQACGDALLIAHGLHRTLLAGRSDDLRALLARTPHLRDAADPDAYERALRFKLRPAEGSRLAPDEAALRGTAARWGEALLAVERARTGRVWHGLAGYAACPDSREGEPTGSWEAARNWLKGLRLGTPSRRPPRDRLYRELARLLAWPDSADWGEASARFLAAWRRL